MAKNEIRVCMKHKNSSVVNFEGFVNRFMSCSSESLNFNPTPIQVYPLSIAFSLIKPPIPLFRTSYNFFLFFLDGGGQQQIDNDVFNLNANDILFIREGHLNAIKSIDPATDGYYVYLDSLVLSRVFADKAMLNQFTFNPKHSVTKSEMTWLCECCRLMAENEKNSNFSQQIEVFLLSAIVLRLAHTWPAALSASDRQSEIAMLFKELVYENFMTKRDVKFYADALAISNNYLNRCVNYVTGKAPKQHINEVVIYHSKVLLQDYSKDISQVAYELNFADPSHFGRLFKEISEVTPSQYRSSLMQDSSGHSQDSSQ